MSAVGIERALILLKDIAVSSEGAGVRDLARSRGYSPSVVAKSLQALLAQGFVEQEPDTKRYRLGPATLQVGLAGLVRLEIRQVARPHLQALADATGETVLLGVRHGDIAIYIDKVLVASEIRVDAPLGTRRPLNCTAAGKAFLAFLSDAEMERLAAAGAFIQATPNAVTDAAALKREMAHVRERGVATDREEFVPGIMCVASPVRNHEGVVVAAVTVSGPVQRVKPAEDELARKVIASAGAISAALGYAGSYDGAGRG